MEASPTEVRIEHSVVDQRALGRAFTVLYAVLAAAALVAALVKPELLLGALFLAALVAWWAWRVRRAQAEPWLVVLTPTELRHSAAGVDVRISRADAAGVRVETKMGPRMQMQVCKVRDPAGRDLLTVSLPGRKEAVMLEAAFEKWGWPVR
jgi:hypothetical protein